jgi:hypothetical protein
MFAKKKCIITIKNRKGMAIKTLKDLHIYDVCYCYRKVKRARKPFHSTKARHNGEKGPLTHVKYEWKKSVST